MPFRCLSVWGHFRPSLPAPACPPRQHALPMRKFPHPTLSPTSQNQLQSHLGREGGWREGQGDGGREGERRGGNGREGKEEGMRGRGGRKKANVAAKKGGGGGKEAQVIFLEKEGRHAKETGMCGHAWEGLPGMCVRACVQKAKSACAGRLDRVLG